MSKRRTWPDQVAKFRDEAIADVFCAGSDSSKNVLLVALMAHGSTTAFRAKLVKLTPDDAKALAADIQSALDGNPVEQDVVTRVKRALPEDGNCNRSGLQ